MPLLRLLCITYIAVYFFFTGFREGDTNIWTAPPKLMVVATPCQSDRLYDAPPRATSSYALSHRNESEGNVTP